MIAVLIVASLAGALYHYREAVKCRTRRREIIAAIRTRGQARYVGACGPTQAWGYCVASPD